MPKSSFFLNYGGPGDQWYSSKENEIEQLEDACKTNYGPPHRSVEFSHKGLKIKVLTYSLHRALLVELLPGADSETKRRYQHLREEARDFCRKDYSLLGNNCVTATTRILHRLDPALAPEYLVLPWSLDDALKRSPLLNIKEGFMKPFFDIYDRKEQSNYFSFVSQRSKLRALKSVQDVFVTVYHGEHLERERTKSSLIELNWVVEDEQGILHPTSKAPTDFILGLQQFNQDYQAVIELKFFAELQGIAQEKLQPVFQDNPDYETACARLKERFEASSPIRYQNIVDHMENWKEIHAKDPLIEFHENDTDNDDSSLNV
ncbi:MAG: hypothetical protein ACO1N3_02615 [Gammaproteobacteria bacterium]